MAKAAGMTQGYYSRLEKGKVISPKPEYIEGLARALDTTVSDLLDDLPRKDPLKGKPVEDNAYVVSLENEPTYIPKYSTICNVEDFLYGDGIIAERRETIIAPPIVQNARGAYALVIANLESAPKYVRGDTIYVNPDLKPTFGDDVVVKLHYGDTTILLVRRVVGVDEYAVNEEDQTSPVYQLTKITNYVSWLFDKASYQDVEARKNAIKQMIDLFPADVMVLDPPDKTWRSTQIKNANQGFPERIEYDVIVTADNGRFGLIEGRLRLEREERLKQGIGSLLAADGISFNVEMPTPKMTVHRSDKS